jgi:hypothetical protein
MKKDLDLGANYNIEGLKLGDIFEPLRPLLATGRMVLDSKTGKIRYKHECLADWDSPWLHVKHHPEAHCGLWHRVMFDYFKFVPSGCMTCWKVVIRPRYIEDLFKLLEMQLEMDVPSKCGTELRPNVFGAYGGYFYQRSMEEGQERYEQVMKKYKEYGIKLLIGRDGKEVKPLLKRACTEFEMELGPSDKWIQTKEQMALEKIISKHVHVVSLGQPNVNKPHVVKEWIEQAYSLGDPTVWQFNDNKPFFKDYVTYHKEVKDA